MVAESAAVAAAVEAAVTETVPALRDRFTLVSPSSKAAWRAPLAGADAAGAPELYGPLTAGDELGVDALLELAAAGALHRDADLLYADEVRPNPGLSRSRSPSSSRTGRRTCCCR